MSADQGVTEELATDAFHATRVIEAAVPSAAAATFVRPPPAFRLATTSLWVPTHGSDYHASSGSERGEGSGRRPHAANAGDGDSIEAAGTPAAVAAQYAYIPSDPSAPGTPSDGLPSRSSVRFADADASVGAHASDSTADGVGPQIAPGEARVAPWRVVGAFYRNDGVSQVCTCLVS